MGATTGLEAGCGMSKHSDTRLSKVARSDEEFIKHERSLLESPAWWARSPHLARLLDLLELEHLHNGGKENGRLRLTYGQIAAVGVPRKFIASIIAEGEALGLIVATRGPRESRTKSAMTEYRITYLPTRMDTPEFRITPFHFDKPGHEWRQIDADKATAIAAQFRLMRSKASGTKKQNSISRSGLNQFPNGNQPSSRTGTTPAENRRNSETKIVRLVPEREHPSRIWPYAGETPTASPTDRAPVAPSDAPPSSPARDASFIRGLGGDLLGDEPLDLDDLRRRVDHHLGRRVNDGAVGRLASAAAISIGMLSNFRAGRKKLGGAAALRLAAALAAAEVAA